jgi:membrane protease YdiL (CAAX protease family)
LVLVVFLLVAGIASPLLALWQDAADVDTALIHLPVFATALAAAAVWCRWRPRLLLPPTTRTATVPAIITALGLSVVFAAVLWLLAVLQGRPWNPLDLSTLSAPLPLLLFIRLLSDVGEEIGWRGVVQPLLEPRLGVLGAGAVTGVLFGLGHFPVLLVGGTWVYLVFVIAAVGLSLTLAVLTFGRTLKARVVLATLLHWLTNTVLFLAFADGDESLRWMLTIATATTAAAVVSVGLHRRATLEKPLPEVDGLGFAPALWAATTPPAVDLPDEALDDQGDRRAHRRGGRRS